MSSLAGRRQAFVLSLVGTLLASGHPVAGGPPSNSGPADAAPRPILLATAFATVAPAPPADGSSTLHPSDRETILRALRLAAAPLKSQKKSEAEILAVLKQDGTRLLKGALDFDDPQSDFTAGQAKLLEDLVSDALTQLKPAGAPSAKPEVPATPATPPAAPAIAVSHLRPTEVPIIFRVARTEFENLKKNASLDDKARAEKLQTLVETKFAQTLDLDGPDKLSPDDRAEARQMAADVIAGKEAPALTAIDSRFTPSLVSELRDAIQSRARELVLEGATAGSENYLRQLREFGEAQAKSRGKLADLTPTESRQIGALVDRTRTPDEIRKRLEDAMAGAKDRKDPTATGKLTAELRDRILNLLRQINKALAPLGFDADARKAVLSKFVLDRFADVATDANALIDQVLRDGPSTTSTGSSNNQTQLPTTTFMQTGGTQGYYLLSTPHHCFLFHCK